MDGTGGFTNNSQLIKLETSIKPRAWRYALKSAVAHEYNHALWLQLHRTTYQDTSNLDWFIMEGLAQVFEEKITRKKPSYARAVSVKDARKYWQEIKPKLDASSTDLHEQIFFGKGGNYPRWTGYTLSYLVIKKRFDQLQLDWKEIMKMDPKKLVPKDVQI